MRELCALLFVACACAESASPPPVATTLPPGAVARVAGDDVRLATVERIAAAQRVSAGVARDLAVRDALFAAAARADPELESSVNVVERAAHGRELLEALRDAARQQGPPSDPELEELTRERWTELDRPVSVRTLHAVVLAERPNERSAARAKAEELLRALSGASDPKEFLRRAKAFSAAPFELRAERLYPVAPDGRNFDPSAKPGAPPLPPIDAEYTKAAHALASPGALSSVVETPFGFHVILLEERLPERRPSRERRRALLADEVVARRAEQSLLSLMARLREGAVVEVPRAAEELTALVVVQP